MRWKERGLSPKRREKIKKAAAEYVAAHVAWWDDMVKRRYLHESAELVKRRRETFQRVFAATRGFDGTLIVGGKIFHFESTLSVVDVPRDAELERPKPETTL